MADPAPLGIAAVACHVIAAFGLVDGCLALGALTHLEVHVVQEETSFAADLAAGLVVGIPALEACLEAARTDCTSIAAAARSADDLLTAWPRTPFELA